jgi:hypothetical protein
VGVPLPVDIVLVGDGLQEDGVGGGRPRPLREHQGHPGVYTAYSRLESPIKSYDLYKLSRILSFLEIQLDLIFTLNLLQIFNRWS